MVFATLGTHHQAFPRLIEALTAVDDLVVQYGHSPAPLGAVQAVDFLPYGAMEEHMRRADVVISHAGVGSILLAQRTGHTPLVVPRLARLGEHVDDHQSDLVRALGERGTIVPVWDTAELPALVASAPRRGEPRASGEGRLHRAVRAALAA